MTTLAELDMFSITLTFKDATTFTTSGSGNKTPAEECLCFALAKYDSHWRISTFRGEDLCRHPEVIDIMIER